MITRFSGEYRFLSNFYPVAHGILLDGLAYPTVEHAYQAAKTLDLEARKKIQRARTGGLAKTLGRRLPLREGWDALKLELMDELLQQKFRFGPLRDALLATGDEVIIEGNTWGDKYWGAVGPRSVEAAEPEERVSYWVGQNHLGKILMRVRAGLR